MNRSRIKPTIGQQHVSAVNSSFWWWLLLLLIKPLGMITESWTHFETYILLIVYIFTERLNKNTVRACVLCTFTKLTKRSFNSWKCGSLPYFMCYEQVLDFFFSCCRGALLKILLSLCVTISSITQSEYMNAQKCSRFFQHHSSSDVIWRDVYSLHQI